MLVTTKKKIYLNDYGVIEKGTEIDVPQHIVDQFGGDAFEGIEPVVTEEEPVVTEEKPKRNRKKADEESAE